MRAVLQPLSDVLFGIRNRRDIARAAELIRQRRTTAVFVTSLLRPREIKMATALRKAGWSVVLLYKRTTPFTPDDYFDVAIQASTDSELHRTAKALQPRVCHVFSGAVDDLLLRFCRDKPGPVVVDVNDVFCPSLFNYLQERFAPTRECLEKADAICARDLQPKFAERYDGFRLPRDVLLFSEYTWRNELEDLRTANRPDPDEVRVVSVGTISLESQGWYDSGLLQLACMLAAQKIHLHIYPNWFYRHAHGSAFNLNLKAHFTDFFRLQEETPYLHVHESLPLDELARELPQYDFGIISGGCQEFGQKLKFLTDKYMHACYSGRISDYLDAGLPILINREVAFNHRLLQRYGVAVDLAGILEPGFRDRLLAIKRDRAWTERVQAAARRLSLNEQSRRLTRFYEHIAGDDQFRPSPLPSWITRGQRLPIIGRSLRRLDRELLDWAANTPTAEVRKAKLRLQAEVLALRNQVGQLRAEVKTDGMAINDIAGLLNWSNIRDDHERNNGFAELVGQIQLCASHQLRGPNDAGQIEAGSARFPRTISVAWQLLNQKNLDQLLKGGYDNFKRTIALNYFTFPIQAGDPQIAWLEAKLSPAERGDSWKAAQSLPDDPSFHLANQVYYRYFVLLLWTYARRVDRLELLDRLQEPAEGNPVLVPTGGRPASQDVANSLVEYYSMREGVAFERCTNVLEIGGGYGRNAQLALDLHRDIHYTLVDIPPALYVAQRYLSSVFRNRPIFSVRDFSSYEDVREEIERCSIVFLLPHQLSMMPAARFDLALSISSLGEMTREQIEYYFAEIGRVTRGHFYTKQWKKSQNPFDGLVLTEKDYPFRPRWRKLYSRECAVQSDFFEALYEIGRAE